MALSETAKQICAFTTMAVVGAVGSFFLFAKRSGHNEALAPPR